MTLAVGLALGLVAVGLGLVALVAGLLTGTVLLAHLLVAADEHRVFALDRALLALLLRDGAAATWATLAGLGSPGQPAPRPVPGNAVPVLLVPGYGLNRASLAPLARRLQASGRTAWAVSCRPFGQPVATYGAALGPLVEQLCAATGASRVDLVGHSMGGSVAAWYIAHGGGAPRVRRLVTLGTAWGGTALSCFGRPPGTEMRPGTDTVQGLQGPLPVPTVAIVSSGDPMVVPRSGASLPWQQVVRLQGIGHYALLRSTDAAAAVIGALDAPAPNPPGASPGT